MHAVISGLYVLGETQALSLVSEMAFLDGLGLLNLGLLLSRFGLVSDGLVLSSSVGSGSRLSSNSGRGIDLVGGLDGDVDGLLFLGHVFWIKSR